jgi:hypothetical protein
LTDALQLVATERRCHLFTIVGGAGVGNGGPARRPIWVHRAA